MATLKSEFIKHVGSAFARQMALADSMEADSWSADLDMGSLALGNASFSAQILGSHATESNTWLWAWGNEQANFPPSALEVVEKIRSLGVQKEIPELYERLLPMDSIDPHMLAMICTGIEPNTCYYPGAYDGGTAFFIITNPPNKVLAPVSLERACSVVMQVISNYDVDHRGFLNYFLKQQGFEATENNNQIEAKRGAEGGLTLRFNDAGLIEQVDGTIQPRKEKKSWWRR